MLALRYQVLGKRKDIADQNQATSAIRVRVKSVNLETYKFSQLDVGTGLGNYSTEPLKRGKKSTKRVGEPLKTRPNTFI